MKKIAKSNSYKRYFTIILSKPTIASLSIYFFIIIGLIGKYIEHFRTWTALIWTLAILFFLTYTTAMQRVLRRSKLDIIILILNILCILNCAISSRHSYLLANIYEVATPIIVSLTIFVMYKDNKFNFDKYLRKLFGIINLFWLLNLYILSKQITGSGFMMKSWWIQSNEYYQDLCSGLFGFNGTHELAFFSSFVMIYNLYIAFTNKNKFKKIVICIFIILTEIMMCFYSIFNDNKVVFILIPFFSLSFYYFYNIWTNKNIIGFIKVIMALFIGSIILMNIPPLSDFFNKQVIGKLIGILDYNNNAAYGGNERLAIANYALSNGFGWILGIGIGNIGWVSTEVQEFAHYGLSSIGSFIYQGGLIYYLMHCIFYFIIFVELVFPRYGFTYKNISVCLFAIFSILFFSTYSTFFTSVVSVFWVLLTFLILGLLKESTLNKR